MLAYKIQMPVNHPEESIQHSEHGKSLKSGIMYLIFMNTLISYFMPSFKNGTANKMHEIAYKKANVTVPG
jgi:hypothetical protein